MSNKKLSIWVLGFLTLIICSFFYFRSNRFVISNEKGESSYKIDQWSGETWLLYGSRQIKIEADQKEEPEKEITKAVAIEKVKDDETIDYDISNSYEIKSKIEELEGKLKVIGWEAKKINDQTYLISFKFQHKGENKGYHFEFNTKADVIRYVNSDMDLMKHYEVGLFAPPTKEELENARTPEEAFN